jgi:hypothetical protein
MIREGEVGKRAIALAYLEFKVNGVIMAVLL